MLEISITLDLQVDTVHLHLLCVWFNIKFIKLTKYYFGLQLYIRYILYMHTHVHVYVHVHVLVQFGVLAGVI